MAPFSLRRFLLTLLPAGLIAVLCAGCLFGGGNGGNPGPPGSVPTATPPNPSPTPIDLGNPSTVSGNNGAQTGTGEQTYVTASGDTLLAIALNFGVPPEEQAAWINAFLELNALPSASALQAGVEYKIPPFSASANQTPGGSNPTATPGSSQPASTPITPGAAAPTATHAPNVQGGGGTYTVVAGDYPLLIAEKLGIPPEERQAWVDALVALNGIDPSALSVGQVLELPAGTPAQAPLATLTPVP